MTDIERVQQLCALSQPCRQTLGPHCSCSWSGKQGGGHDHDPETIQGKTWGTCEIRDEFASLLVGIEQARPDCHRFLFGELETRTDPDDSDNEAKVVARWIFTTEFRCSFSISSRTTSTYANRASWRAREKNPPPWNSATR